MANQAKAFEENGDRVLDHGVVVEGDSLVGKLDVVCAEPMRFVFLKIDG
jgi:hypothetical protein